ncbi:MAG: hypothetical protein ACREQM_16510 [Candidatus Dormibacteraceae bacterium]
MTRPPEEAASLMLDLVRPEIEAGRCPRCGEELEACGLAVQAVEPDRIAVAVTCASCSATLTLTMRPTEQGGAASVT